MNLPTLMALQRLYARQARKALASSPPSGGTKSMSDAPMLLVRFTDANTAGGKAVQLCDANGEPLPGQMNTCLTNEAGGASVITVSFAIDGKTIKLSD